jgi:hypothetical protein
MAALWPPELDKRTLRRGGATQGSFLWAKVVARGGIEGGDSVASLRRNRGEKGGSRGAGQLGRTTQRRRGGERGGPVHVALKLGGSLSAGRTRARRSLSSDAIGWVSDGGSGWTKMACGPTVWTRPYEQ